MATVQDPRIETPRETTDRDSDVSIRSVPALAPRIERLREQYFKYRPTVCLDRALVSTVVFRETEGEPIVVRRAKALKRYCETKTILIQDDELIIGNAGCEPRRAVICPELSNYWLNKELDTLATRKQDPYQISEEQKETFRSEIYPYWRGKTVIEHWLAQVPADTLQLSNKTGILDCEIKTECGPGEIAIGYSNVLLPKGYGGIRVDAERRLTELDAADPQNIERIQFLHAVVIVCEAMAVLARRHAEAARDLAKGATDVRGAELEAVAEVCDWVATEPPRTLHECLQLIWFTQTALFMELNAPSYSPGRVDQYLYPYYRSDREAGRLDQQSAQELIDCLWVKFAEQCWYLNENSAKYYAGYTAFQNLCVGGVTPDGRDAVNELSYMILQASMDARLCQPSISVRLSRKNPDEFVRKVAALIRLGTGFPAVHSDEVGIKMLLNKGVLPEEARDWCLVGCVEPNLSGKISQWSAVATYNFGSAIEFALADGLHLMTGQHLGVRTGDPREFASFDQFVEAVKIQLAYFIRHASISSGVTELLHQQLLPSPLASCLMLDCVEKGRDLMRGGARYTVGPGTLGIGIADAADSLAVIEQLVYREKRITMDELIEAVADDFEGHEKLLAMVAKKVPKYGNDDDSVDHFVRDLADFVTHEHHKYRTLNGEYLMPSLYPVSSNVPSGEIVSALPFGRRAGKPLADGVSPCQGTDRLGPTAVLRSVSKFNHEDVDGGTLCNLKLDPSLVAGEEGLRRLADFLLAFLDMGQYHVQFNVVDEKTLLAAQANPDEHRSLLVRVAGYSAYFVELYEDIQNDIISRTTQRAL